MKSSDKSNKLRIGVLGGIGPEASAYYYSLLIERMQEGGLAKNNPIPEIVIYSLSVSEMTRERPHENDLAPYVEGIAQLNKLDVNFIVMVCNTIHIYIDILQDSSRVPILNLIEATKLRIDSNNQFKKALVLGTRHTIKSNLFKISEERQVVLTDIEVELLSNTIEHFNRGIHKDEQREKVLSLIASKNLEPDDFIVLGCTEFAVMLRDNMFLNKIDTVSILVDLTIEKIVK